MTGESDGGYTDFDFATLAYDAVSGARVWEVRYASLGSDYPSGLAVSPDGARVFVTGTSAMGYASLAYDAADGSPLWRALYDGASQPYYSAWAGGLVVGPDGARVFVTGHRTGVTTQNGTPSEIVTLGYPVVDSDRDGLPDWDEVNIHGTDRLDPDTDDDGLLDGEEVYVGTDPLDADTDDDGLTDREEVKDYGTNPRDSDTDDDGLTDREEVKDYGTNPRDSDTDDDGLTDRDEIRKCGTTAPTPPTPTPTTTGSPTARRSTPGARTRARPTPTATGSATARRSTCTTPTPARPTPIGTASATATRSLTGATRTTGGASAPRSARSACRRRLRRRSSRRSSEERRPMRAGARKTVARGAILWVLAGVVGVGTAGQASATAGAELWEARYSSPRNSSDEAHSLAVSPDGARVYVTGETYGSGSSTDYATLAYDAS
ncbi:MAG: hypothetical protein HY775_05485, partial [Acidobacteria bacterium]|nr:hypothetical protein [Acidobacteriota bacterium]